jgi:transcriptional regulator with XRE-family HTH domain
MRRRAAPAFTGRNFPSFSRRPAGRPGVTKRKRHHAGREGFVPLMHPSCVSRPRARDVKRDEVDHEESSAVRIALLRALAENVRRARRERGLTQAQVAERMRVSVAYVGIIEGARRNIPYLTVVSLARALGVPPARLFDTEEAATPDAATRGPTGAARAASATPGPRGPTVPEAEPPISLRRWRAPPRRR